MPLNVVLHSIVSCVMGKAEVSL